ncbi:MAG: RodZ domain-containing protein [Pseudomonadota bacterium]
MTDQPDNTTATAPLTPHDNAPLFSVGSALREARVRQGLSVAEVSNRIKFAPRQIEALEADDFANLPEIAFVRGFVRSYARSLQLDPVSLLAALPRPPTQPGPSATAAMAEVPYSDNTLSSKSNLIWLTAALIIAVLLVIFVWLLYGGSSNPAARSQLKVEALNLPEVLPLSAVPDGTVSSSVAAVSTDSAISATLNAGLRNRPPANNAAPAQVAASAASAPLPRAAPPAPATVASSVAPAANNAAGLANVIRLTFDEDSWVEIKDKTGNTLLSQLSLRGSEQTLGGQAPFTVVIGHANGVHLYYKGQPVDLKPYTKVAVARLTLE